MEKVHTGGCLAKLDFDSYTFDWSQLQEQLHVEQLQEESSGRTVSIPCTAMYRIVCTIVRSRSDPRLADYSVMKFVCKD